VNEALRLLTEGEVEVEGRLVRSSNQTFLVSVSDGEQKIGAIYKPGRGERALWDFPPRLFLREIVAYQVSEALGLGVVPETVHRHDAPFGEGSLQRFVDADFSEHYFTLLEEPTRHDALREIAAFDLLVNNADRKGGHCLLGPDDRIWAIDHGLCFHVLPKLRTVIWDFAGEPIPASMASRCAQFTDAACAREVAGGLLEEDEIEALVRRAEKVAAAGARFPVPTDDYRHYPWPLV
jgi:uncharacterized repeat protein (TIGR03843 family)